MHQQHSICNFKTSESWVILTPIEQSIKEKIEQVGTPLKDWDIQINYGIKTGYNDAFIINSVKRDEILANCADEEERNRTAELIRPILRGRDIKRYGYSFEEKYLIATFPSRNYNIDEYQSLKQFLEGFKPKIKQTGNSLTAKEIEQVMKHALVNGILINENDLKKSRKKTNNKWFETQDSISYWEDFSKPKIVYPETTQGAFFAFDNKGLLLDKTCFMLISENAKYLQLTFSSKLFELAYKRFFSSIELGVNGYQYNKHALIKLPVRVINENEQVELNKMSDKDLNFKIYELYSLTQEEIEFVENREN